MQYSNDIIQINSSSILCSIVRKIFLRVTCLTIFMSDAFIVPFGHKTKTFSTQESEVAVLQVDIAGINDLLTFPESMFFVNVLNEC